MSDVEDPLKKVNEKALDDLKKTKKSSTRKKSSHKEEEKEEEKKEPQVIDHLDIFDTRSDYEQLTNHMNKVYVLFMAPKLSKNAKGVTKLLKKYTKKMKELKNNNSKEQEYKQNTEKSNFEQIQARYLLIQMLFEGLDFSLSPSRYKSSACFKEIINDNTEYLKMTS